MSKTYKFRPSAAYYARVTAPERNLTRLISLSRSGLKYVERSAFDSPPYDFEHVGMTSWAARLMRRAGRIAKRHGLTYLPFFKDGRPAC